VEELINAYKKGDLILFVGAGVPINLGLPSWKELINQIGGRLGYDPEVFTTYGDPLALAEFYRIKKGSIGPLRSWMDREWHRNDIEIKKSNLYQAIALGNYKIVYTTNYDRWLEISYQENGVKFRKIVNVNDLISLDSETKQIIKYHGDFDDDSSIVLSESSYYDRLEFESPLDLKLRSDLLGKSVLFIGYNLSDINIRLMFYKLTQMWKVYGQSSARPKSYLFSSRPNPIQKAILETRGIHMLTSAEYDPGKALTQFMIELNEKAGFSVQPEL
jgi:hypothetical protein